MTESPLDRPSIDLCRGPNKPGHEYACARLAIKGNRMCVTECLWKEPDAET